MSEKSFLGTILKIGVAAGVAAAAVKFVNDYTDYKPTRDGDTDDIKESGNNVKSAAKKTYVALFEKGNVEEAAGELLKATGDVVSDAGKLAGKVGRNTVDFAKKEREKYCEDPEEYVNNIKDDVKNYGESIACAAKAAGEKISETLGEDRLKDIKDKAQKRYDDAFNNN